MPDDHLSSTIAEGVSEQRIWHRLEALAAHGATGNGGVRRLALSEADIAARRLLCEWAHEIGARVSLDCAGNMFARLEGDAFDLPPVLSGSHIDTVPTGGRFDGAYGVVAAFEVLQVLKERGVRTGHPVEAVVWTNEEGARFPPGQMGAGVFVGARNIEDVRQIRDKEGVSVDEALDRLFAAFPDAPQREGSGAAKAFVEAHIEQGPVLEAEEITIGAVTGIQGRRSFVVDVIGAEAHGGTSRLRERKDALLAAVNIVHALQQLCADGTDDIRFTVGVFNAFPGAPLVVPGRVHFTVDVRHPDNEIMQRVGDQVPEVCQRNRGPCEVVVTENANAASIYFPEDMVDLVERQAVRLGYPCRRILSLAGHDGRELVKVCPTGMVFVPCKAGVSHNETESATAHDLSAGTKVLLASVCELAGVRA